MGAKRWARGYTADRMAAAVALVAFPEALVALDRCLWLGPESDLLVVPRNLRAIEIEIKVTRADFRADRKKARWHSTREPWPRYLWKHYYAVPAHVWSDSLIETARPESGILLVSGLDDERSPKLASVRALRKAKPDRHARVLTNQELWKLARLATLRMWDSYARLAQKEKRRVQG